MSKFPNIKTSIFSIMSKMADDYGAINLSQGFPNFPVDPQLIDIVIKIVKKNIHQYLPSAGFPPLLDQIEKLTSQSYGRSVSAADEILVTAGATQGIFATIQALVSKNDEVIILDPSFDCYEMPVLLVNAKAIHINLNTDFTPNWTLIANAMTVRTKMIIINNPNNPSGKTWTENDFLELEKLLNLFPNILVLSDEVYEYITFENQHISVNTRPKIRERSIVISSFGKSFHITGWKIGYAIAPEHLMLDIKKVHQYLVFSVNSVAQAALNDYLKIVNLKGLSEFYQSKRDLFRNLLEQSKFTLIPCEGSYFQVASYAAISGENDIAFAKRLVVETGVAAIPLSVFYETGTDQKMIRFCFAKDENMLKDAAKRLCDIQ